jgi:hypothetical protein
MAKRSQRKRNKPEKAPKAKGRDLKRVKNSPSATEVIKLFSEVLRRSDCVDERALARLKRPRAFPLLTEAGLAMVKARCEVWGLKPKKLTKLIERLLLRHQSEIDADITIPDSRKLPKEINEAYERDSDLKKHVRDCSYPSRQADADDMLDLPPVTDLQKSVKKRTATYVSVHEYLMYLETTEVPPYQREYVWTEKNLENLFGDLEQVQAWDGEDAPFHFLGTVLIKDKGKSVYQILDGQQRTMTFCLFVAVAARLLRKWGSSDYAHDLVTRYLAVQKGRELRPKFTPNPADQAAYWEVLSKSLDRRADADWAWPGSSGQVPPEKSRVQKAAQVIENKLSWLASDSHPADRKRLVLDYLHKLLYRCAVCKFSLWNTDDALATFRTLNSRGQALENSDILRSIACKMSGHTDGHRDFIANSWEPMVNSVSLGKVDPKRVDMFFSAYAKWMLDEPVTKPEVVDKVAEVWQTFKGIEPTMESVNSCVPLFNAVTAFGSQTRHRFAGEDRLTAEELGWLWVLSTAGVSQEIVPFVMLQLGLRSKKKLKAQESIDSLRFLASWTVRRNIQLGQSLQGLQKYMLKANKELRAEKARPLDILLESLDTPDQKLGQFTDAAFEATLKEVPLARKRDQARAILYRLDLEKFPYDDQKDRMGHKSRVLDQVEHVCPQVLTGAPHWETVWAKSDHEEWVHRLGNIVLLEPPPNKEAGRQGINEKLDSYRERSNVRMTINLGHTVTKDGRWSSRWNERWGVELVRDRTAELAKLAVQLFPFPYADRKYR